MRAATASPGTSFALNPGVAVGTTNPRTASLPLASSATFAQITATSATVPLVIHILTPSSR